MSSQEFKDKGDLVKRAQEAHAEKPIGKHENERQDIGGEPISKEDAAYIQSQEQKAGNEPTKDSLAARVRSAASVNVREGRLDGERANADVKPFDEEPYKSDLEKHGNLIGGGPDDKRDICGNLITMEDSRKIQKLEVRLGHDTSEGSLAARVLKAASANVKDGKVPKDQQDHPIPHAEDFQHPLGP